MDKKEIQRILEDQELPTLPQIIGRIQEAYDREKTSANEMAAILETDHAIAARILRLANSAYYGLQSQVASVPRAVVVLGFTAVRDLALTTAIFDTFSGKRPMALDPEGFWMHSLGTAKAANLVARRFCPQASADGCFTAGLLHDLGKFLLALAFPEEYKEILVKTESGGRPLSEVERAYLGTDHAEVGALMAENWNLPELFAEVIRNLPLPLEYRGPYFGELRAVSVGHNIALKAGYDGDGLNQVPCFDQALLGPIGLTQELIEELEKETRAYWDMAAQFFHILQEA